MLTLLSACFNAQETIGRDLPFGGRVVDFQDFSRP
jgi:predicted small secreted protein